MKKTFIRTKNVKQFVSLMDELQKVPPNIPKMALVYGEHGLGKSQTIQWWADKNDSVYVRATQGMTSRWLLSEIAEELGEEAFYHSQETSSWKDCLELRKSFFCFSQSPLSFQSIMVFLFRLSLLANSSIVRKL